MGNLSEVIKGHQFVVMLATQPKQTDKQTMEICTLKDELESPQGHRNKSTRNKRPFGHSFTACLSHGHSGFKD